MGGLTHEWVEYYEQHISSDQSCLNEWNAMDNLESRRPPSPDSVRSKPTVRDVTEQVIRSKLKEIMMSVDLDEVTSKYIRTRLEEDLDMDLAEYKSFIDQEMLVILGQMDAATEIFEHVYLGSEWNASNLEELHRNGVSHILNVTREIDNFFPGIFNYLNIRVYDDEKTELLKHWDDTYRYIHKAKSNGSKVLVHCKMGVSRSASVVIAYAMKAYNWELQQALDHVKQKRSCIKPNSSFMRQLEIYQGMLLAMKNRDKLQRSKSETNLKSPGLVNKADKEKAAKPKDDGAREKQPTYGVLLIPGFTGGRPKSWSPDDKTAAMLFPENASPQTSLSAEHINVDSTDSTRPDCLPEKQNINLHLRMPCSNGQTYSVTQNQVLNISCPSDPGSLDSCGGGGDSPVVYECVNPAMVDLDEIGVASVRDRVSELEAQKAVAAVAKQRLQRDSLPERKGLVLNLATQFENGSKPGSPVEDSGSGGEDNIVEVELEMADEEEELRVMSTAKLGHQRNQVRRESDSSKRADTDVQSKRDADSAKRDVDSVKRDADNVQPKRDVDNAPPKRDIDSAPPKRDIDSAPPKRDIDTAPSKRDVEKENAARDLFSAQVDRVFDREERRQPVSTKDSPSRQSSWGSYDSAVVLSVAGDEAPSRQSSWGSGDAPKWQQHASRNSSWGSYDMRPMQYVVERTEGDGFTYDREAIPWTPGTVRRTKQMLEKTGGAKSGSSSDGDSPAKAPVPSRHYASSPVLCTRKSDEVYVPTEKLASSAPSIHSHEFQLRKIENFVPSHAVSLHDLSPAPLSDITIATLNPKPKGAPSETAGVVRTLREEFEAKSGVPKAAEPSPPSSPDVVIDPPPLLPSPEPTPDPSPDSPKVSPNPLEDISVRNLVDRFEVVEEPRRPRASSDVPSPPSPPIPPAPSVPPRKSSLDLGRQTLFPRPPPENNNNNNNNQHHRNRHCPRTERNNSTNQRGVSVGGLAGGCGGSGGGRPPPAIKPMAQVAAPVNLVAQVPVHIATVPPHLATQVQPNLAPHLATQVQPHLAPHLATQVQPHLAPHLATQVQPHLAPHLATQVQPHLAPHLATQVQPHLAPHLATQVPAHLPPPAPSSAGVVGVPSSSILPTKVRKQQGKTHPLDKLVLKQPPARHPNPVYNTM